MAAQNRNRKVKRLALMGLLFALAMALSFLESLLPALPMLPPGIRLGLSNIVTMYALFVLGPVSGYTIAVLKSLFVLLTRGAVAAAMSASGGIASVTVMLLLSLLPGIRRQYLLLSVFGGAAHNVGQLIAARFIISNQYVWYYLPVLLAAGLLMGAITGMALRVVMPYLDRLSLK
ncbi:MAG: Gx transporter family protein [Angelakisella sp.]|jgi:heptaprenyl diphosphate synthase component I